MNTSRMPAEKQAELRRCGTCGETKPRRLFMHSAATQCTNCYSMARKAYKREFEPFYNSYLTGSSRARALGLTDTLTKEEIMEANEIQKGRCAYCLQVKPLILEHCVPLSRKGSNSFVNIVLACVPCNSSKRDRTPAEYGEYLLSR